MLNYEVDPNVLKPFVPAGTELDSFNGRTYASMVGFMFLDTQVLGIPIPFHRNFEEINLRFYVRREIKNEVRRGVVFIREIVPRAAIAFVARALYGEKYIALPTRHQTDYRPDSENIPANVLYEWKFQNEWNRLSVRTIGEAKILTPNSEEEFITEHYWGYANSRNGKSIEYQVEHPSWRVWRVGESELVCDVEKLYGSQFVPFISGRPSSAFLAEGSTISVGHGKRLG